MPAARTLVALLGMAGIGTATLLSLHGLARADDESAILGEVSIEHVAATPARAGETTKVTFSIENGGTEDVVVTGVLLATGEPSRVMGFLGHTGHTGEIGAFRIGPGEAGRLDGKNVWIEIGPLKQGLAQGSVVTARLLLGLYDAPISIHVSPTPRTRRGSELEHRPERIAGAEPGRRGSTRC